MQYTSGKRLLIEIRKIMEINDIQVKELAVMIGKSQQSVSQIFKVGNPRFDTLLSICQALNIKLDIHLLDRDNNEL